jgi:hypothetical protein
VIFARRGPFPRSTLYGWHSHWIKDPEWHPYTTKRRLSRRVFSVAHEEELIAELWCHYWIQQHRLSSRRFTDIVLRFWRLRRRSTRRSDRFCASPHFRIRFCQRNGLSLRTPHLRKPATGDEEAKIAAFARQLDRARATYGEGPVINMDETSWTDVQLTGRTIAPKRCDPCR